jgi:hypothetical protein
VAGRRMAYMPMAVYARHWDGNQWRGSQRCRKGKGSRVGSEGRSGAERHLGGPHWPWRMADRRADLADGIEIMKRRSRDIERGAFGQNSRHGGF